MKLTIFLTILLASNIKNCDSELKTIQGTSEYADITEKSNETANDKDSEVITATDDLDNSDVKKGELRPDQKDVLDSKKAVLGTAINNTDQGKKKSKADKSKGDTKKKFPVTETPADCDSFETCSACHSQNNWHSCGWCPVENKCSLEDECSTLNASDIGWQDRNGEYCKITRITHKVPHKLFVYSPGLLSLHISNIDSENGSLECLFKINGTNSVTTNTRTKDYGVDCNTPALEELIPYFPDDGDHLLTNVEVRRTQDNSLVSTTDYLFYDCSSLNPTEYCQWCLPITMCTLEVHSNCINSPKLPDNASPIHCPMLRTATPEGPQDLLRAVGETIELILTVHVPLPYQLDDIQCRYSVDGEAVEGASTIVTSNVSKVIEVHCHEVTLNFTESWGARNASVELIWRKFSLLYNPENINIEVYQCEYLGQSCSACSEVPGLYPCGWCSASSACTLQHRCADHQTWITNSTYCPPEPLDDDDDSNEESQYTVVIVAVLVPIFLVIIAVVVLFWIRNGRSFGKKDPGHLAVMTEMGLIPWTFLDKENKLNAQAYDNPCLKGPVFDDQTRFRSINKTVHDTVVPSVLMTVVEWGSDISQKPPDQTLWEFIFSHSWNSKKKREFKNLWSNSDDQKKLAQKDFYGFDIKLFIQVIRAVCRDIASAKDNIWKQNKMDTLECLLTMLSELRNAVTHNPETTAPSPDGADRFLEIIVNILKVAGSKYDQNEDVIMNKITKLKERVQHIKDMHGTDKEQVVKQVRQVIRTDGMKKIKQLLEEYRTSYLPLSKITAPLEQIFYNIKLLNKNNDEFECTDILKYVEKRHINIIEGMAGSGKTTLLKKMAFDCLGSHGEAEHFTDSKEYDLVLFVQGREHRINTFSYLLTALFGTLIEEMYIMYVIEAIKEMKTLILIDGIDELNSSSEMLVWDILYLYKDNDKVSIIVTSRPYALYSFKDKLERDNIPYQISKIKEISTNEEQQEILSKFQLGMTGLNGLNIVELFCNQNEEFRSQFVQPLQLALFCTLIAKPGNSQKLASEIKIMQQTVKLCEENMKIKLQENMQVEDPSVVQVILKLLYCYSLRCLNKDQLFIGAADYDFLKQDVLERCKLHINVNAVISSILSPELTLYNQEEITYNFIHKAHQEYLSAKGLVIKLATKHGKSLHHVMVDEVGHTVTALDLKKKYNNVIKFVILELNENQQLMQHKNSLQKTLKLFKPDFQYCLEVVRSSGHSKKVADLMADVVVEDVRTGWCVNSTRHLLAAQLMLRCRQPRRLVLSLRDAPPTMTAKEQMVSLVSNITEVHRDELELDLTFSHDCYAPTDDVIIKLAGSRCRVERIKACVASEDALTVLRQLFWDRNSELVLSLPSIDCSDHNLHILGGVRADLRFTARFTGLPSTGVQRPLPLNAQSCPPLLTVTHTKKGSVAPLLQMIMMLAPAGQQYDELRLQHSPLLLQELQDLVGGLQQRGIRTGWRQGWADQGADQGATRAEECPTRKDGLCWSCLTRHNNQSLPCYQLRITKWLSADEWAAAQLAANNDSK